MRSARTYMVVTTVDVAISSQGTNKPRNASVSLFVDLRVYFYTFHPGLSSGNRTAEETDLTAKRLRVTNMTGLLLASFFLDIQFTILVLVISKKICLKEGEIWRNYHVNEAYCLVCSGVLLRKFNSIEGGQVYT